MPLGGSHTRLVARPGEATLPTTRRFSAFTRSRGARRVVLVMNLTQAEETALLDRCRAGDESAWAECYRLFVPMVARFLQRGFGRLSANPGDEHDDVIQKVFVELFTSLPRLRGDARLATWLYRIAQNLACKATRSWFRRDRRIAGLKDIQRTWSPHVRDASGQTEAREELRRLDVVLETLSSKVRLVWVLVELEGLTPKEAGEVLRIGAGTVRSRLFQARKLLSAAMGECSEQTPPEVIETSHPIRASRAASNAVAKTASHGRHALRDRRETARGVALCGADARSHCDRRRDGLRNAACRRGWNHGADHRGARESDASRRIGFGVGRRG